MISTACPQVSSSQRGRRDDLAAPCHSDRTAVCRLPAELVIAGAQMSNLSDAAKWADSGVGGILLLGTRRRAWAINLPLSIRWRRWRRWHPPTG